MVGYTSAHRLAALGEAGGELQAAYVSSDGRARWLLTREQTASGPRLRLYLTVDGRVAAEVTPAPELSGKAANASVVVVSPHYLRPPSQPRARIAPYAGSADSLDVWGERVPNAEVGRALHQPAELLRAYVRELREEWRSGHAALTARKMARAEGYTSAQRARDTRAMGAGTRVSFQAPLPTRVARNLTHVPARPEVFHGWSREELRRPEHRLYAALLIGLGALGIGLGGVSGSAVSGQMVAGAGAAGIGALVGIALAAAALVSRWRIHGQRKR